MPTNNTPAKKSARTSPDSRAQSKTAARLAPAPSNGTAPPSSTNEGPAPSSARNRGTGGLDSGFPMPCASQQTSGTRFTASKMKDSVFFNRLHGIYRGLKPAEIIGVKDVRRVDGKIKFLVIWEENNSEEWIPEYNLNCGSKNYYVHEIDNYEDEDDWTTPALNQEKKDDKRGTNDGDVFDDEKKYDGKTKDDKVTNGKTSDRKTITDRQPAKDDQPGPSQPEKRRVELKKTEENPVFEATPSIVPNFNLNGFFKPKIKVKMCSDRLFE